MGKGPEVGLSALHHDTFNYAPVSVGAVLVSAGGYWLLSARRWFTGPRVQGREENLKRLEAELAQAAPTLGGVN